MPHAIIRAMLVYAAEPCARTFGEDLNAHLFQGGIVINRPDLFVMARPVRKAAAPKDIVNPHVQFPANQCDCLHVYLLAGNMRAALALSHVRLEWVSFERQNILRFHKWELIERLIPLSHGTRRIPFAPSSTSGP